MKKSILLILLVIVQVAYGQKDVATDTTRTHTTIQEKTPLFQGYSGGMMLHAGYLFGKNSSAVLPSGKNISPQGFSFGLYNNMPSPSGSKTISPYCLASFLSTDR